MALSVDGKVRILDGATAAGAGASTSMTGGGRGTVEAHGTTSSGTGAAIIEIQVSNNNASWQPAGTINLNLGETQTSDRFELDSAWLDWLYVRANVDSISGTGASVSVYKITGVGDVVTATVDPVAEDISVLAGARLIDVNPTAVISSGTAASASRAAPFGGWGAQYSVPSADFQFDHLRVAQIRHTAASVAERWHTIVFTVRSGTKDGTVIATATYKIPAYTATLNEVIVKLDVMVTASLIGGSTYWVDYCAYNSAGALCPCGEYYSTSAGSAMSNFIPLSAYYRLTTTSAWVLASGDAYRIAIEPYISTDTIVSASQVGTSEILLPTLYGVVGRELNCYFTGLIEPNAELFEWDVTCTIGGAKQQNNRFTAVPAAISAGTAISVSMQDPISLATIASASSNIVVADAAKAGTCELLLIGDSTTAGGDVGAELLVLDTADANIALTLDGTQGTGLNKHEGYSGWSSTTFVTTGSPFYNAGTVNMSNYITTNGFTGLTHVIINLGINDVFSPTTDVNVDAAIENYITNVGKMVQGIQAYSSSIKIGVALTTPPSHYQDAFGYSYLAGQTLRRYRRNWFRLIKRTKAIFDLLASSNVYLLPYCASLDTVNNMYSTVVAANSRNATTVTRQSNGVHPAASGYLQIADVVYAWIKCTLP